MSTDQPAALPPNPPLAAIAYLRGRGIQQATHDRVESAIRQLGLHTTHDRLSAWHMCRGGVPTVMVDFSDELDSGTGLWHGYKRYVIVGAVRARYEYDEHEERFSLIVDPTQAPLVTAASPEARKLLDDLYHRTQTERTEFVLLNGGRDHGPWRGTGHLDEARVAELVARAAGITTTQDTAERI